MDTHVAIERIGRIDGLDERQAHDRSFIAHMSHRGEFLKPCPGTTGDYLCCGYQVLTPLTGCGMYCSYCVLQAYFDHQCQIAYDNLADLEREVRTKLQSRRGVIRVGTGEFGDSLYAEPVLGYSRKVAAILEPYDNVLLELKTKSTNVDTLDSIVKKHRVVVGFSMNTPSMVDALEHGTAPIDARLAAARRCEEMGFWVAFHFDPMIWYQGCETEYRRAVAAIYKTIRDPARIAWCSLGAFRTMPRLKTLLKGGAAYRYLFTPEMAAGGDGKLRYFRPLRARLYSAMREVFEKHDRNATLYLCMESPELWSDSGMIDRIPDGLRAYLDRRAASMIGYPQGDFEGR